MEPRALLTELGSSDDGLSSAEAAARLRRDGPNAVAEERVLTRARALWNQLKSPLMLLLLFAVAVSAVAADWLDALIVLVIVCASAGIGYRREYRAHAAAAALRQAIKTRARVLRDGREQRLSTDGLVRGDVVLLAAGSLVPADLVALETTDCLVSEAVLTGESYPVEKKAGRCPASTPVARRSNSLFLGTNVRSGTARCVVIATGKATEYGQIAHKLSLRPKETEFDRGVRRFGELLAVAMLVMIVLVFVAHALQGRPPVETLLFSIALAVGLSPELLPAILSVNLARGAEVMARSGVLVRRLNAIENLGSMDVLCTDKTGTLTEGVVRLSGAYDPQGQPSPAVLELAAINAAFETGLPSPLDDAILEAHQPNAGAFTKRAEVPFDFVRKRVSVIVEGADGRRLITKGAFRQVLAVCSRLADGAALTASLEDALTERYARWSGEGTRVLAVATARTAGAADLPRCEERDLAFEGFLTFTDHPKAGVAEAIKELSALGVRIKLITGDSGLVARHVAGRVGLPAARVLSGAQLDELSDEALWHQATRTDLFVEVDPNQKERIISSLKRVGHVVGFLGDGVNDAPAMHAADTSLSVDDAVDVAREAADFVLLERHLDVLKRGIQEGRRTFANTLKYVLTTTSANLGNMLSMAVASLFLPFLPLLASQILLNNFISDVPAVGIADDRVDRELVDRPRRWDMRFIARFMIEFGALSSAFDLLTFGGLLFVFHARPELFRTGWFVESLLTELVIALVVRTRRPFFKSRPGNVLLFSTLALIPATFAIPYLPGSAVLGFVPMPAALAMMLVAITLAYVVATEALKATFYRPHGSRAETP